MNAAFLFDGTHHRVTNSLTHLQDNEIEAHGKDVAGAQFGPRVAEGMILLVVCCFFQQTRRESDV